ncbi:Pyridoxamine 5'-phosphate oxidase [Shewanella denitrificans OS217]|jgi:pyridoxamine 5'-phosphate oxidase|uniref:Pyridoxamine 5'-phosphate oxidase n=1 Tax=Shewanella denitrificans (strain OS217 / ATCC BAA-1090 / DSM 15013) TaxID=318161 RepID=Q12Q20_SHEDO|nr:pyridoxal 5'-phosphate synthase [Shewanella denitrificans]ABE54456.1 Pyridoxamine 5'-phosphate oxidase [Shewanella denitrificans OS217]
MTNNPFDVFKDLYQLAREKSVFKQKGAICISTIDEDGFPDSRFVDLKEIISEGFVFCTDYASKKGVSIADNSKIGLTVWWEHISTQIRVKGIASKVSEAQSQQYWDTRSRSAQLTTWASKQSQLLDNENSVNQQLEKYRQKFDGQYVPKPPTWGGYLIKPKYFEFLTFREDRMHIRNAFVEENGIWVESYLQP